jgi:hypothetical protein
MGFFKAERAVVSAIFHIMKLGFTMAMGEKTTAQPHPSPETITTTDVDVQHAKLDGTKSSSKNIQQLQDQALVVSSLDSCLYKNGAMVPFHCLFETTLLSPDADYFESYTTASTCLENQSSAFNVLNLAIHNGGAITPFHAMFEPGLLQDPSDHTESSTTDDDTSTGVDGRISPTSSSYSSHITFSESDNLPHTRRSSWATTIDSSREEEHALKLSAEYMEVTEEPCVLFEYQHYHHLITVESPDLHSNASDDSSISDYTNDTWQITNESSEENRYEERHEEIALQDSHLQCLAHGEIATAEVEAATCAGEYTTYPAEENLVGDESSMYEDGSEVSLPASPEEAAAWAHSHCPANPEGTKIKILKDQHGQEYVLYHDCIHCLPKELAPEFFDGASDEDMESESDENFEDDSDDDHENAGRYEDGETSDEDSED